MAIYCTFVKSYYYTIVYHTRVYYTFVKSERAPLGTGTGDSPLNGHGLERGILESTTSTEGRVVGI